MYLKRKLIQTVLLSAILLLVNQADSQVSAAECNPETHYQCSYESRCILKKYVCNGEDDCGDNEDEQNCDAILCRGEMFFKCRNGVGCVAKSLTCNQVADCLDNSDESDTMCDPTTAQKVPKNTCNLEKQFECQDNICIPKKLMCDGTKHCLDGSDENMDMCKSKNISCPGFKCANGDCLHEKAWECDGTVDCSDGSDENGCKPHCNIDDGHFLCKDGSECLLMNKVCNGEKDCVDGSDEGEACNKTDACKDLNCDGLCKVLPTGPMCVCKEGFTFNNETKKCEDINECASTFGICTQGCVNTNGSYYCTCTKGFMLKNDHHTCIAQGRDAILLYTTPKSIKSIYLNAHVVDVVQKTRQAIGVTFDGQSHYWTDITDGKESIMKWTPGAKKAEVILTAGLETPEDLAVDWLTGNIYFTDANLTQIAVCTNSGYYCTQLVSSEAMDKPRSITLHPSESLMYWTDWGRSPHIGVAFMDGSEAKVLVDDNMHWPNGIALDWPNGRLYWVDAKAQTIESVTIAGKDRRVVLADIAKHPFGIAVFEDKLYWSDWDTRSIESCNKFTGKNTEPLVQGEYIYDVHIFHDALMPRQKHACMTNKCSHICLLAPNKSFTCACPDNMELVNGFSCQLNEKAQNIILAIQNYVVAVPHQNFGRHVSSGAEELENMIDRLAFNSINGQVFVADSKLRKIKSFDIKSRTESVLVGDHILSIQSIAFDYLANNIYWIDDVKSTIEVFSLNTNKRAIVLHFSPSDRPIAMALIPSRGEIFVTLQSVGHVHIDRQSMKGGHDHFHVIESGLSENGQIHIAVDEENQIVYWSDSANKKIEFSNFEGSNIKSFAKTDRKPGPLALIGGDLYWTSLGSNTLRWRSKNGTGGIKTVAIEKPPGLRKKPDRISIAAGIPLKSSNHMCMVGNGGCSDICVSDGVDRRACLCETGHFFKDSNRTTCIKRNDCGFICSSSGECIESSQKCDKKVDCLDGLDEKDCTSSPDIMKCGVSQFMCKNEQQCIPLSQRCDQHYNCKDRSDESNCSTIERTEHCKSTQLRCPSGHCLDVNFRCDGKNDCGDDFDEREDVCLTECPADFFKCASGQCIPKEFECNSYIDCSDISDEHAECPTQICKTDERPCPSGWCVDKRLFCDGHEDCEDGFDELKCTKDGISSNSTCDEDDFACTSDPSQCYTIGMKCDGKNDCPGGEDEKNCPPCASDKFECRNERCIVARWVCDGVNDCGDNSDEVDCNNQMKPLKILQDCAPDQFKCKDGLCLEFSKVCDDKKDCQDGDDEEGMCKTACKDGPCAGNCTASPKGAVCSCSEGFQLVNGKHCEDIDECKTMNPCSQGCENTNGSFICSCADRYMLGTDRLTCKALGGPKVFLFALYDQIRKFTELPKSINVIDTESKPIADIDISMNRKKVIYTLKGDDELVEMDMESNATKVAFEGVAYASKIAHDWITENTYTVHHADDMKVKINVCNMVSKGCALIRSLDYHEEVTAIRVDPLNKLLFYVEYKSSFYLPPTSRVVKSRLDGSDPQVIANGTTIKALALDTDQQRVYFTETLTQSLHSVDYSGENKKFLITQSRMFRRPIAMALFENHVYVLKQASQMLSRCKLYGDMECHEIDILANNARQLVIGHQSIQKMSHNNCENHSCEIVCIPADLGFKCLSKNGTAVAPLLLHKPRTDDAPEENSSGGFWLWTFITLILISAFAVAVFLMYRRRGSHGRFNVSLYFRNNEMGKGLPQDTKPTPFPRTVAPNMTEPSAPSVNTLNRNCHELVNDEMHSYKSMTTLNVSSTDVNGFSDDDTEDMDSAADYSTDPHQRLIF